LGRKTPHLGSRHYLPPRTNGQRIILSVLDPELAAVLFAVALAAALAVPGWMKAVTRAGRFCESCGRRVLQGEKTCDCD
jgi:hypothetical protein